MEKIKTLTISGIIANGNDLTFKISTIPFIPTSMIIKNINYSDNDANLTGIFMLWSDLINDFICSFKRGNRGNEVCDYKFLLNGNLMGTYFLRFQTVDNEFTNLNGHFGITIEFRG